MGIGGGKICFWSVSWAVWSQGGDGTRVCLVGFVDSAAGCEWVVKKSWVGWFHKGLVAMTDCI